MNWWEILKWVGTFVATAGSLIAFAKVAISQMNKDFSKKMDEKFEDITYRLQYQLSRVSNFINKRLLKKQ